MKNVTVLSAGLGIFTLLFGPGNIIYPLTLGAATHVVWGYALFGFVLTAVIVPMVGLVASLLYKGDYMAMLSSLGKIPGMMIAFACMLLIGPFCIIPRCIALAREVLGGYVGPISPLMFSIVATGVIFAATLRKEAIMPLFGRVFGPIKLSFILAIFVAAVVHTPAIHDAKITAWEGFSRGLFDGYGTMDLLGTLFCTGLLAMQMSSARRVSSRKDLIETVYAGLRVGIVGGGILTLVYGCFFYASGKYAAILQGVDHAAMFNVLAEYLLGWTGRVLASSVVMLTCITTVMALSAICAEYVRIQLFAYRCSYPTALIITLAIAGAMSNAGFGRIMAVVEPIVAIMYPMLILLALSVIWYKLFGNRHTSIIGAASVDCDVQQQPVPPSKNRHDTMNH